MGFVRANFLSGLSVVSSSDDLHAPFNDELTIVDCDANGDVNQKSERRERRGSEPQVRTRRPGGRLRAMLACNPVGERWQGSDDGPGKRREQRDVERCKNAGWRPRGRPAATRRAGRRRKRAGLGSGLGRAPERGRRSRTSWTRPPARPWRSLGRARNGQGPRQCEVCGTLPNCPRGNNQCVQKTGARTA